MVHTCGVVRLCLPWQFQTLSDRGGSSGGAVRPRRTGWCPTLCVGSVRRVRRVLATGSASPRRRSRSPVSPPRTPSSNTAGLDWPPRPVTAGTLNPAGRNRRPWDARRDVIFANNPSFNASNSRHSVNTDTNAGSACPDQRGDGLQAATTAPHQRLLRRAPPTDAAPTPHPTAEPPAQNRTRRPTPHPIRGHHQTPSPATITFK